MMLPGTPFRLLVFICLSALLTACNNTEHVHAGESKIVARPEEIRRSAEEIIESTINDLLLQDKPMEDSIRVRNAAVLQHLYQEKDYAPLWSEKGVFKPWADSLFLMLDSVRYYGLFPSDYHYDKLQQLRKEVQDTAARMKLDAGKWAFTDILLSAAYVQVVRDLVRGHLVADSVLAYDSVLKKEFYLAQWQKLKDSSIGHFVALLEPEHKDYRALRTALYDFVPKASFKKYSFISTKDSAKIPALVYQRLSEVDSLHLVQDPAPDSLTVAAAVKKYQKRKGWKVDGRITAALVDRLNLNDNERFIRLAIALDRYRMQPALPMQHIWVNIPSFQLQVRDSDTVVLQSRVVVGKPITRTPLLTSSITDMITYPKWHIPESIIQKEILPGLKRDPGYTLKKGYALFDKDGNEINPYTVKWSKFEKNIPYKVVQGSGDENALGVMKFNFPNEYSVYLHDTNQRYLFSKSSRALSHGCVRVQEWQQLATFLLKNDSTVNPRAVPLDTLNNWLALKEKHVISFRKRVPLYIRYYTCEVKEEKLVFYEDIYGEDRRLREKLFADK